MLRLAVIGKDVSKSLSPQMHRFILEGLGEECVYDKISLSEKELEKRANELFSSYDGFNVTIPHKRNILPFLSELKGDSKVFGAVNTVVTKSRTGHNTDGMGFLTMLDEAGISVANKRILILGIGGAGRSCIYALAERGAIVSAYGRNQERLEALSKEFDRFTPLHAISRFDYDMVVNCTSVGMHDSEGTTPFIRDDAGEDALERLLENCEVAIDLIYEPRESAFLRLAREKNKRTLNGEAMLFFQAYAADCIFLGREQSMETARELWRKFREENS